MKRRTLALLPFAAPALAQWQPERPLTMIVAFAGATLSGCIGTLLDLRAAFFGGWVDAVISRLVDIWMSFPAVLLAIVLVAVIGTGLTYKF